MSRDNFLTWLLGLIGIVDIVIGLVLDHHYLVTQGFLLLVLAQLADIRGQLRARERGER